MHYPVAAFSAPLDTILRVVSVVLVLVAGAFYLNTDTETSDVVVDQVTYQITLDRMRAGAGFYEAFDEGFVATYGDHAPSPRDFRLPTLFWLLSSVPGGAVWNLFVASAVLAGLWPSARASVPIVGPAVTLYLLNLGVTSGTSEAMVQFLYVEIWAAPWFVVAVVELVRGNRLAWLASGLVAFSLREQGSLLLIGATIGSWAKRSSDRFVAISSVGLASLLYGLHVITANAHVDPGGTHTPLNLGRPPLQSMLEMATFNIPIILGILLWLSAVLAARRRHLLLELLPLLALPLTGFYANRPYWGIMFVPPILVLAMDLVATRRRSTTTA